MNPLWRDDEVDLSKRLEELESDLNELKGRIKQIENVLSTDRIQLHSLGELKIHS